MGKYSLAKPGKAKQAPEPPTFIDVIEVPTNRVDAAMGVPFAELYAQAVAAALRNEPGLIAKKVEFHKLAVAPGPGLSWLRDYKGMPSLYRQN